MSEPTKREALPTIVTTPEVHVDDTAAAGQSAEAPAAASEVAPDSLPAGSSQSHGRNFSISSTGAGHARNASLTVPGGDAPPPSSPTLSTTSEMSAAGPDSPSPAYRTSLALRDNDPRTAHARQVSNASAFTDASGELQSSRSDAPTTATGGALPSASSQVKFEQSSPTSDGRGEKLRDVSDAQKKDEMKGVPADEADAAAELSGWQRFKASVHGKTRAGRAQAIQDAIDAEKKRQYEMDPAPFKYRPVELGELVDPKSVALLRDMGGVKGLLAALGTDGTSGLDVGGTKAEEAGVQRDGEKDIERAAGSGEPRGADWVQATHEQREKIYGRNVLPTKKSKSLLLLMWLALQDKILILLCVAAVVSLALGLYTDFGADPEFVPQIVNGELTEVRAPQIDWVEGVAILIAVVIVDVVGSVNDYQKELQFKKLNAKKEERDVKVIRQGRPALMSVHDVCVGDVLQLEPGEILPADGVFLRGHNVKCDESGATGESDMIRKITYDEALEQLEAAEANGTKPPNRDCFLISGARVLEGAGEYVVIAVGPSSFNGKLMLSLRTEAEMTPLQAKLNRLAEIIAYCGSAAGLLLFVALMIRFFVSFRPGQPSLTPDERGKQFIDILVIAVTVVVVAVPEGLPLATTLALAFATKRMTEQNLLVRVLGACETMANASVICTDKTGTLTQNEMSVVAGSVGVHLKFAYNLEENKGRIESPEDDSAAERMASRSSLQRHEGRRDWAIDQQELGSVISGKLRTLLSDSISVNSSAFEEVAEDGDDKKAPAGLGALKKVSFLRRLLPKKEAAAEKTKQLGFVGSKTETALLKMAKELGWEDYRVSRERNEIVTSFPFSSERKAMGVVIRRPEGGYRFLVKGASEVLTKICTRHVIVPDPDSADEAGDVQTAAFTKESQENVAKTIIFYANQTLRTIGICYRDFDTPSWPPQGATLTEEGELDYDFLARDLTLLAVVGIEDPLRPGVRDAVAACTEAGVQVKMCTGDNALTARSIATQCGIYTPGGIIMEGPVFRKLSDADMDAVVPRLQVLARSSPEDKKILVERLKRMGEIVGVTGDGTNDGPALKAANVGFSMGIAGTEVAKEASDIILMDDNFASIVKAIMWGRCVNDAVRRFLQFQLSVNVGAVLITFISAVASDEGSSVLGAVQLLWLNLIMDTLAALALATDPATAILLKRKPDRKDAPLISTDMWKMIIGQSIYQVCMALVLDFRGNDILGLRIPADATPELREYLTATYTIERNSLIFNAFVWCQLFNQVNCRELGRKFNFFAGIHRNKWFMGIILVEIGLQVLISFVGKSAFGIAPLQPDNPARQSSRPDWAIVIIIGLVSWPLGVLIRCIPTAPCERLLMALGIHSDPNRLPTVSHEAKEAEAKEYGEEFGGVAERLSAFSRIRGGRSQLVRLAWKSKSRRMRDADVHPQTLMALVPALIGASVGGGWRPTNPEAASRRDPAAGDPSVSSWQLYQGGAIQLHPDTANDDQFLQKLQAGGGASKAA